MIIMWLKTNRVKCFFLPYLAFRHPTVTDTTLSRSHLLEGRHEGLDALGPQGRHMSHQFVQPGTDHRGDVAVGVPRLRVHRLRRVQHAEKLKEQHTTVRRLRQGERATVVSKLDLDLDPVVMRLFVGSSLQWQRRRLVMVLV